MLTPAPFTFALMDQKHSDLLHQTISMAVQCPEPGLAASLQPLLARPGKRLRPMLAFGTAACGPAPDHAVTVKCAAALELMHLSSLIHDDLMDHAETRSGLPTLHTSAGAGAAIVGGDYLMGVGGRLVAEVSTQAAIVWQRAYIELCLGQARETANSYRTDVTMSEYLAAIRGKTAALTAASCRLGALCGGFGPVDVAAFARFGEAFGMVFQLVDDLMDVVATAEVWAKPVGQDVPNGVYTACVIATIEQARSDDDQFLRLLEPSMNPVQLDHVHDRVRRVGTARALELIDHYVHQAEQALAALPDSSALAALVSLPRGYVRQTVPQESTLIVPERVS